MGWQRDPSASTESGPQDGKEMKKTNAPAGSLSEAFHPSKATELLLLTPSLQPLIDVVLLPMQGGVGLDDDAFASGLLEFVD